MFMCCLLDWWVSWCQVSFKEKKAWADVSTSTSGQVRYFNPAIARMLFKRYLKKNKAGVYWSDCGVKEVFLNGKKKKCCKALHKILDIFSYNFWLLTLLHSDDTAKQVAVLEVLRPRKAVVVKCNRLRFFAVICAVKNIKQNKLVSKSSPVFVIILNWFQGCKGKGCKAKSCHLPDMHVVGADVDQYDKN